MKISYGLNYPCHVVSVHSSFLHICSMKGKAEALPYSMRPVHFAQRSSCISRQLAEPALLRKQAILTNAVHSNFFMDT
jgi:hypothetical protein